MTETERVDLAVPSETERRIEALRDLLPEAFVDGTPDLQKIGEALGLAASGDERYGLSWAGKSTAQAALQVGSVATLRPDVTASSDYDRARNVLIEGDNLETLRLLQRGYNDKIKLIYIDPPYNTGNDFIYKDDFKHGLDAYLRFTAQVAQDGTRLSSNSDTSGRYHSDWLTMMYPRLAFARNLLTQDGVILVSINDAEVHNLRHLMDDVFGVENWIATFVWNNDGNIEQQSAVKSNHEYIVAYARNLKHLNAPAIIDPNIGDESKLFNEQIENSITKNGPKNPPSVVTLPVGFPASADAFELEPREDSYPHILDPVRVKDGALIAPARLRSGWSSRRLLDLYIANGQEPIADAEGKETRFALTSTGAIYLYKRRLEAQSHMLTVLRNMGTTKKQGSLLAAQGLTFSFPKPEFLIEYLVSAFTAGDDLVCDFFAGSGTTAASVLRANLRDEGARRFLLVQLDEPLNADNGSQYRTLSEMTIKRVQQAVADTPNSGGFRLFRLAPSNFKVWDQSAAPTGAESLAEHLALFAESLAVDATDDGIVAEILLKEGITLDTALTRTEVAGETVVTAAKEAVAICLARAVSDDLVAGLIALHVPRIVMLESAFAAQDALKSNTFYRFRDASVTLRTV